MPKTLVDVVVAHKPNAGPITAVRNIVLRSSLGQLQAKGYYERYCELIPTAAREDLLSRIAPGWTPIDLAITHYEACDRLNLSAEELSALGFSVGAQVSDVTLISRAKKVRDENFDAWTVLSQLHRMWPRIYQGGSVQVSRVDNELLIEQHGFVLNRFKYFRHSQCKSITVVHESVGILLESVKIESYSAARDEIVYRLVCR